MVGVAGQAIRVLNGIDADGKEQFLANALPDKAAVDEVMAQLEKATWRVRSVEKKERQRRPSAPYTTSKLQQDAAGRLGFNVRRTMGVAQRLYEGVEIGNEGTVGLITYMRTDSTRISPDAVQGDSRLHRARSSARSICRRPRMCTSRRRLSRRRMRMKRFGRRMCGLCRTRFGGI